MTGKIDTACRQSREHQNATDLFPHSSQHFQLRARVCVRAAVLYVYNPDNAIPGNDRSRQKRFERIFREILEILEARIMVGLPRDRQKPPLASHPAGEAFVQLQSHLTGCCRLRVTGCAKDQPVLIEQVQQAGVALHKFDDQGDDSPKDLLQTHIAHHKAADLLEQTQLLLAALQTSLQIPYSIGHTFIIPWAGWCYCRACENEEVLFDRDPKLQGDEVPAPVDFAQDVIISPDTRRIHRVPPGQSRTKKWPVLDASGPPRLDQSKWRLRMEGLVRKPVEFSLSELQQLPRTRVFADFHCVTRWSRLGNLWEGVSTRELVQQAGGVAPEAKFVLAYGYDHGWTTNVPLEEFLAEDALVALLHDGDAIDAEHGGPARLIIPRLYAWKSAKWLASLEFLPSDRPGFWERNGYHMHGDPWREERYGW